MDYLERLDRDEAEGRLPPPFRLLVQGYYESILKACGWKPGEEDADTVKTFELFLRLVEEQCVELHQFDPVHIRMREPVDHYQFGLDVMGKPIDREHSEAKGLEHLAKISEQLEKNENVVVLANHQAESDPQAVSILLEDTYPKFAEELFFVAGERVLIDPIAATFSMGRNLICVYSKKYIENPPEKRGEKQAHNTKTMRQMLGLFNEGGVAVCVFPSGGRDRPDEAGDVAPAPFDPKAVEMFRLMASHSSKPVHFYPLALATHNLLPPPSGLPTDEPEVRYTRGGPVHLAFGPEIDMNHPPGAEGKDKRERRELLANHAHKMVCDLYFGLPHN